MFFVGFGVGDGLVRAAGSQSMKAWHCNQEAAIFDAELTHATKAKNSRSDGLVFLIPYCMLASS